MKPSPGDLVRITQNAWENLGAGSYTACYVIEGCIAKAVSWEEYCDYLRRQGDKSDFEDLKRWMERAGRNFTFILMTDAPAPQGMQVEGADFTFIGEKGAAVLLRENEFKGIEPK
jgi:hypothetical protein